MTKYFAYSILLFFLLLACAKEEEYVAALRPSNLIVEIDTSKIDDGFVELSASAQNANYYSFEFFFPGGSEYVESTDGKASYAYQDSGIFNIRIKAHASFDVYLERDYPIHVSIVNFNGGIPNRGYSSPMSYSGYTLVWQDEFDGNGLAEHWSHEVGTGTNGWGNNELQYYRPQNTEVRDGLLLITAKLESFSGSQYTSSRLVTKGNKSIKYGRVDIRAVLPKGKGLWPALWMLGDSYGSVGWPSCGEIDIMEMVGGNGTNEGDDFVHGTIHWDNNGQHAEYGGSNKLQSGAFADEFHVFSIIWDANTIKWFRDDIKYHEVSITPSAMSEFQEEFFFIFNVAVGGNWPGSPTSDTQFPQIMAVDYVRVFQK